MLIPSNSPDVKKAKADSQNNSDMPNKMMDAPKPAMQNSIVLPWCFCMGIKLINIITVSAPKAGADLKSPSPSGPVLRITSEK